MPGITLTLMVDPTTDAEATGRFAARVMHYLDDERDQLRAVTDLVEADIDADTEPATTDTMFDRLRNATPANAAALTQLRTELEALGMTFYVSVPRGGGEPRTYLRVLRADGTSAAHVNSARFVFMAAADRCVPADDDRIQQGGLRKFVELDAPGAVDLIVDICRRFTAQ